MNMSLAIILTISAVSARIAGSDLQPSIIADMQDNSVLRSVTSSQVSVAFLDDSVSSGSTISATLAPATPSVSLSILNASPNLAVSLINNNDGTYTTLLNTPGIAGEYIVSLF
jgi:hypothetical protein